VKDSPIGVVEALIAPVTASVLLSGARRLMSLERRPVGIVGGDRVASGLQRRGCFCFYRLKRGGVVFGRWRVGRSGSGASGSFFLSSVEVILGAYPGPPHPDRLQPCRRLQAWRRSGAASLLLASWRRGRSPVSCSLWHLGLGRGRYLP